MSRQQPLGLLRPERARFRHLRGEMSSSIPDIRLTWQTVIQVSAGKLSEGAGFD